MIHGFQKETSPLTEQEQSILPIFITSLRRHIGPDNAVSSSSIAEGLKRYGAGNVSGARIRKIINHIRTHHLVPCLVSSSKGYYVCNSVSDYDQYLLSLEERASSILAVREALLNQRPQLLYGSQN